jgi:hypothetical protein
MAMKHPVTLEELSEWITGRARRSCGSADLKVTVQFKLSKPDHQGKNWSDSLLINTGEGDIENVLASVGNAHRDAVDRFHIA